MLADCGNCPDDWLTTIAEETMFDTGQVLKYSSPGNDAYRIPGKSWTAQTAIKCGYTMGAPAELMVKSSVPFRKSKVRVPLGTEVESRDRFRLTHRNGRELDPTIDFKIIGDPLQGIGNLVLYVEQVTDGS